jgi:hypothetical protein
LQYLDFKNGPISSRLETQVVLYQGPKICWIR